MKMILCLWVCFFLLSQPCMALEHTEIFYSEESINTAKEALPSDISEIIEGYDIISGQGVQAVLQDLWTYLRLSVQSIVQSTVRSSVIILMVILLCSVFEPLLGSQSQNLAITLFGGVEILTLSLSDHHTFFHSGIMAVERLYDFSTVLLPCLAGTSVAAGASVSAGVKYTAAALSMNLLLNISNVLLIPLLSVYLVSMIGGALFQQRILESLAELIRWGCKSCLLVAVTCFTAYLNIAGLVSSGGDVLASQITKTVLQTALPVVGSILSGTASSMVAGASILRNSIGIFGLLSVLGILLVPFLNLAIRYLLFYGTGKIANFFPYQRFSNLLKGIAGAYGILLGIIGTGFILIFFTLISFMQIVGG